MADMTPDDAREFFRAGHTAGEMAARGLAVVAAWEKDKARIEALETRLRRVRALTEAPENRGAMTAHQAVALLERIRLAALAAGEEK